MEGSQSVESEARQEGNNCGEIKIHHIWLQYIACWHWHILEVNSQARQEYLDAKVGLPKCKLGIQVKHDIPMVSLGYKTGRECIILKLQQKQQSNHHQRVKLI